MGTRAQHAASTTQAPDGSLVITGNSPAVISQAVGGVLGLVTSPVSTLASWFATDAASAVTGIPSGPTVGSATTAAGGSVIDRIAGAITDQEDRAQTYAEIMAVIVGLVTIAVIALAVVYGIHTVRTLL